MPDALGCKWSLAVVAMLVDGPCRTLALRRRVGGIRVRVLTERLRALERAGCVVRHEAAGYPRRVSYALTPAGRRLGTLVRAWARGGIEIDVVEMVLKCRGAREVVLLLQRGQLRPTEILARTAGLGKRRLFERLAWLERRGMVARCVLPSRPPATVYRLTPAGRRLAAGIARGVACGILDGG